MSNNYSEQIFQSIDTIISQRLNEVSFDKTEICEIVEQNKDYPSKYWVTNDAGLKFEAYSTDNTKKYSKNQKVYVTIPQGNYELRKLIIGSYSADEIPKNLYTNPFNHLVTSKTIGLSKPIWAKVNSNEYDDWKDIPANTDEKPNSVEYLVDFSYKNTKDFDYIGLDFAFKTNIVGYQGSYALRLSFWNGDEELTNEDDNTLIISSKDLYGNPYNLNETLGFQHLFPWPKRERDGSLEPISPTEVTKIKLQLIQDNKFLTKQGEEDVNTNTWIQLVKADLKFGYDVTNITEDKLELILKEGESLRYTTGDENVSLEDEIPAAARNLYLNWNHTDTSGVIHIFNIDQLPNIFEYYNIYWLHYVDGSGTNSVLPDDISWNWEIIEPNFLIADQLFTTTISLLTQYKTDQYKAVIKYKYKDNETVYYAESTGLIFENTQVTAEPGATNNSEETIKLRLAEGDTGIYNVYGLDGRMASFTQRGPHTITANFLDNLQWDDPKIISVIWNDSESDLNLKNSMITDFVQDETNKNIATFNISTIYRPGAMNNRITCEVKLSTGEIRRGSLTLQFGDVSASGSNYSFNIDFVGNTTHLVPGGEVKIKATFTKQNGDVMTQPSINWSLLGAPENVVISKSSNTEAIIIYTGDAIPENNYTILQATIKDYNIDNGLNINLTAYLPIPIAKENYQYISGTTRVVYAMDGKSFSKSDELYGLYDDNNEEVSGVDWELNNSDTSLNNIPQLRKREIRDEEENVIGYEYTLQPTSYEPVEGIPSVCIMAKKNNEILWSQPILITSNRWASDAVNDWNGALSIDSNGDGSVKAPFFIAGKKENDENGGNVLTGLVIGDLVKSGVSQGTGIYGFEKGKPRYYLTDAGSFYVGNKNGYIDFVDSNLNIKAENFSLNAGDLTIDNTTGIKLGDKIEINKDDTAKIGGWSINTNSFSHDSNKYYLGQGLSNQTIGDHNGLTLAFKAGNKFGVSTDGTLYAKDGKFSGDITGSSGTFIGTLDVKNGAKINGKLTADDINATNLKIDGANVTGTITAAKISANNISGGSIDAASITVRNLNASNLSSGTIGSSVKIATWKIDSNSIYNGTWASGGNKNTATFMCTGSSGSVKIGNRTGGGWVFGAGSTFGVTKEGELYATAGEIGGWKIGETSLFCGITDGHASGYGYVTISYDGVQWNDRSAQISATWYQILSAVQDVRNKVWLKK